MGQPRAVLDANVLVAALRSRKGASFRLLASLQRPRRPFVPVVTVPLVVDYEQVLLRHQRQMGLNRADVESVVDFICTVGVRQSVFFLWRPILRDPKDDFVLEAAVASTADRIVTHNVGDFAGAESFALRVVTPAAFLAEIGELP